MRQRHDFATLIAYRRNLETFVLALITIVSEIYSDAVLTSGQVAAGAPDLASSAVVHGARDRSQP